jgi:hypothetical protein
MGKRGLGFWVVLGLILALAASASSTPTCMRFLKISTMPRVAAMGDAGVAASDATWAEVNPAHLLNVEGSLVTFAHTAWFHDINLETFSVGTTSSKHAFGVMLTGLYTDPLDGYDALGVKQGTFRFYDLVVGATYARRLYRSLSVGASGKMLYEKIDWDSAAGFALDVGAGFTPMTPFLGGRFSLGVALRDLGPKMGYFDEDFDLPLTVQAGAGYSPGWLPERLDATVAVDYEKTRGRDGGPLVGLEAGLKDLVALRVGYRNTNAHDNGDLTFGLGLALANTLVDYAYVDMGEDLGDTHRVSVAFKVGRIFPSPEEAK